MRVLMPRRSVSPLVSMIVVMRSRRRRSRRARKPAVLPWCQARRPAPSLVMFQPRPYVVLPLAIVAGVKASARAR